MSHNDYNKSFCNCFLLFVVVSTECLTVKLIMKGFEKRLKGGRKTNKNKTKNSNITPKKKKRKKRK